LAVATAHGQLIHLSRGLISKNTVSGCAGR